MDHINQTIAVMKAEVQQQIVMNQIQENMGGMNVFANGEGQRAPGAPQGVLPNAEGNLAGLGGRNQAL
jgi:hypothetical protein